MRRAFELPEFSSLLLLELLLTASLHSGCALSALSALEHLQSSQLTLFIDTYPTETMQCSIFGQFLLTLLVLCAAIIWMQSACCMWHTF